MLNKKSVFACWLIFKYEVLLTYRHFSEVVIPLLFFAILVTLFPLAISPEQQVLEKIAPGILWIITLLSVLLTLEKLFRNDVIDGGLEQLLLSPGSLTALVLAKLLAHWVMSILPLIIVAPLLGLLLHLSARSLLILEISLLLGTPVLLFIGAIGRSLTVKLRNSSLLVSLIILPLYIPVLIFGASSVALANQGIDVSGQLAWLGVFLVLTVPLAPYVIAAALRIGGGLECG